MGEVININNHNLKVKTFNNERIVTFKEIDRVHERPEGTAGRNFRDNKGHFNKNEDFFELTGSEAYDFATTYSVGTNPSKVRKLILITESGYLLLVKTLKDELAWKVQKQLIKNYFRAQSLQLNNEFDVMRKMIDEIEIAQKEAQEAKQIAVETKNDVEQTKHRVDNLDAVNLDGDLRQRLNQMVRKYAYENGNDFRKAWNEFKQNFNTAFNTNIELLKTNHQKKTGREVSTPEILEVKGMLKDAIRVADKMINQSA